MAYVKRIVCLANSIKTGGSCIAGKEVLPNGDYGGWIRPVSERKTAEVWPKECKYRDGVLPKLLDIIDVPLRDAAPHNHQSENHIIDTTRRWMKVGELPWNVLPQLLDRPTTLWINRDRTSAGAFNCMSQEEAATQNYSLALIRPENFVVKVGSKAWDGEKTRTYRGSFRYNGVAYALQLTDRVVTNAYQSKEEGDYPLEGVDICVSLTEPWRRDNNRCHKLVAAVFSERPLR
ncbi:MAG: hypothetical protein ABSC08_08430 [Bryobacteraceae bacterium]|jgi:hypothetical protein